MVPASNPHPKRNPGLWYDMLSGQLVLTHPSIFSHEVGRSRDCCHSIHSSSIPDAWKAVFLQEALTTQQFPAALVSRSENCCFHVITIWALQ